VRDGVTNLFGGLKAGESIIEVHARSSSTARASSTPGLRKPLEAADGWSAAREHGFLGA